MPDGGRELVRAGRARHALAVPALEGLHRAAPHTARRARADRRGRWSTGSATPSPSAPTRPAVARNLPTMPILRSLERPVAEVPGDEHRHRHTGQVVVVAVGEQVLSRRRTTRRVRWCRRRSRPRSAATCSRWRRAPRRRPRHVGEPHGDHGLAQHPLHRTTHAEVGDQRQRRHELRELHRFGRHARSVPINPMLPYGQGGQHQLGATPSSTLHGEHTELRQIG